MDAEENKNHRIIGEFTVPLNQILRAKSSIKKGTLQVLDNDGRVLHKDRGTITIQAETEDKNQKRCVFVVEVSLTPKKTGKKQFLCFCKPEPDNPYLMIERASMASEEHELDWIGVVESEKDKDLWEGVTDIIFKKFRVPFNRLAWAENMDHAIRFSVWSRVDDFKSILYGTYETTVSRLNDYARIGKIEWRDL